MRYMTLLYQGDCSVGLAQLESESADLVILDPPYFEYATHHRKGGKQDKLSQPLIIQTREEILAVVWECIRILKQNRAFFLFTNWENEWWMQQALQTHLRNKVIWVKNDWSMGALGSSLANQYETIFLGAKGNWKLKGKRVSDVQSFPRVSPVGRIHPTEKPLKLIQWIVELTTNQGDLVIDPYLGSGVTAEVCIRTRRRLIGWEIDKDFYEATTKRVRKVESG